MSIPRIFITGGAGFIGTHLCRQARAKGWDVSVLDLRTPVHPVEEVDYHQGDILDDALLFRLLEKSDQVVHLAAKVSVPLCDLDPIGSYATNVLGTVKVVESIARMNRTRNPEAKVSLHFASSAAVYGREGDHGALDESRVSGAPLSHYAHQKRACEVMLGLFASQVPSWSFRFFNVYGPGQDPTSPYSGVISIFSERLKKGGALELFGDGGQTRDFISVHDVVRGVIHALELPSSLKDGQAINFCTGRPISIRELGETLARIQGKNLEWKSTPPREGDIPHSCGSYDRAKKILDWAPRTTLEDGLREMLVSCSE